MDAIEVPMRTKLKQWAGMAALVLGAAGCMVGPDHSAPNARVPADWEQPLAGGVGTNAPAAVAEWWREFQDPKLSALVARAFATNLDLRIAETRVRQARAQAGMAEGDLGPVMRTTGGAERERWAAHAACRSGKGAYQVASLRRAPQQRGAPRPRWTAVNGTCSLTSSRNMACCQRLLCLRPKAAATRAGWSGWSLLSCARMPPNCAACTLPARARRR